MYVMKHKIFAFGLSLSLLFGGVFVFNQVKEEAPLEVKADSETYWSSISETTINEGEEKLFNALGSKIRGDLKQVSYDELKNAYKTTDQVPGTQLIWDTYGGFQYTFGKSGNASPGKGYNREHSIPQSWFDEASPMKSDIVHVVPTDCYVNNRRSNYPYGEVANVTYSYSFGAQNDGYGNLIQTAGISKLGSCKAINGLTVNSLVFEPDDQYKGDFARICLYFATCYPTKAKETDHAKSFYDTTGFPYLTDYGIALCLKWHRQDPVSQKELDRNDGVQIIQKNRNPFVDHPEWVDYIWDPNPGTLTGIEVVNPKTTYYLGDEFVKPTVNAVYDSGKKRDVTSECTFTGFDSSEIGTVSVNVDYGMYCVAYNVDIIERPFVTSVTLTTPPTKLEYIVGESINRNGMVVTASLSDGTTANIASMVTLTPSTFDEVGETTVVVTYEEFEAGSFTVNVKEEPAPARVLSYISKASEPIKKEYNVGDTFDPTGLRIIAHYSNSEVTEDVTDLVTFDVTTFQYASEAYPILVSYTEDGITQSTRVRVKVNGSTPSNGCGGNIATTSIVLASISLAGIACIVITTTIRKKKNEK